ncbi:hypothetical protein SAMN04487895_103417 [Paenibacillus sophorae]|uniref:Uncharacterized protein n=1 Tax=Paenibacillus sophorae TaxID=1333845 RepID=A0A1H8KEZ7_9BACL|nr:hypothetical protein SAMN04487895_103417 [Paenibacillus sophorae]
MLGDLYVAECLIKYQEKELQRKALHAWKLPQQKTFSLSKWFSLRSSFVPSSHLCCEPCC